MRLREAGRVPDVETRCLFGSETFENQGKNLDIRMASIIASGAVPGFVYDVCTSAPLEDSVELSQLDFVHDARTGPLSKIPDENFLDTVGVARRLEFSANPSEDLGRKAKDCYPELQGDWFEGIYRD